MLITENKLDEWVRGNARDAQGVIVELVWRLVAASSPTPKERRFPLGDSIGQHGPDGILDVDIGFNPFVPEGRSYWEIGTGIKAGAKATADYNSLVKKIQTADRIKSTFVFVTPLSGSRGWKQSAQAEWLKKYKSKDEWLNIRVIDGTQLIDWIRQFPAVNLWLLRKLFNEPVPHLETPEQRWNLVRSIGEPPPLTPNLFLLGRDAACAKLKEVVAGNLVQLKLSTHFPGHVVDFVCAYLTALDAEAHKDVIGRCLIVSDSATWDRIIAQGTRLILIADASLDLSGDTGMRLIQKARNAGHFVVFGGAAGGIPEPISAPLRMPQTHQVRDALEKAGYGMERARTLAQQSGGNLGSLLRCLQNLSAMPEWASNDRASELAIAAALGSWDENSNADRAIVESLSGKAYGEWIKLMREVALRSGTPLTQQGGIWKFTMRYEGWYELGPKLFKEHLELLKNAAISILTEKDPKFELSSEERYMANIRGKVLAHSQHLRNGIAQTLALLGSHPEALTSCTPNKAELIAVMSVRKIFADADWQRWAGLNDLLPFLAEAAPGEFLNAVEEAIKSDPCPFDQIFAEEGNATAGRNYMCGVLWALETLAWDSDHLNRVVICLGELAARDPGGNSSNRPAKSLTTILLPWMPQTCAPIPKRKVAVTTLIDELPEVGWALLMNLLPQYHSISMGTRKPAWRKTIPDEWEKSVTHQAYWEQTEIYSKIAITAVGDNRKKLIDLINHIADLLPSNQEELLTLLQSNAVIAMPETDRLNLWNQLIELVNKHRKHPNAGWAMKPEMVDKIAATADRLAPTNPMYRHQYIFKSNDFDLIDENSSFENRRKQLDLRRQDAVKEITANGGVQALLAFAALVQSPWQVGMAAGALANTEVESCVLPDLLESEQMPIAHFAGGYILSRFSVSNWGWVDAIDITQWTSSQIGQFLSFLPFMTGTWERAKRFLGLNEATYWTRTKVNPWESDTNMELAIDQLIQYGRPIAALRCTYKMLINKQSIGGARTVKALLAAVGSTEKNNSEDTYQVVEIITALQADSTINPEDMYHVEWAYLPLLDKFSSGKPKLLWRRLATDPIYFCGVIQLVFRSKKKKKTIGEPTVDVERIAANGYRLLDGWRFPPGCQFDGTYNGNELQPWIDVVKQECIQSGHLESAMTMLGHALIHTPADPDGLWIHRAAAEALNAKDAQNMRDGFRSELYNSRGVHCLDPTGAPEKELATKYRDKAEAVENAGFHRVATTLRELAESYVREAVRVTTREFFDE